MVISLLIAIPVVQHPIGVNTVYWVIAAVCKRTMTIIIFRQRVYYMPSADNRIVKTCSVIQLVENNTSKNIVL
jgi:hypothetical protein